MKMRVIFAVKNTTKAVVNKKANVMNMKPKKNSGLYGTSTHDPCDIDVVLYQLT